MSLRRIAGIAGIVGPLAFTVAWIAAGLSLPGYRSRAEDISDLAAPTSDQPAIAIMVGGFLILGTGILTLAAGLWQAFERSPLRQVVPVLLMVIGAAIVLAGIFRSDCSEVDEECRQRIEAGEASAAHHIHNALTAVIFPLAAAAPAVLAWELRGVERARRLANYSLATAILTATLLALFLTGIAGNWNGVIQRLFVSVPLIWVTVLGRRLLDEDRDSTVRS